MDLKEIEFELEMAGLSREQQMKIAKHDVLIKKMKIKVQWKSLQPTIFKYEDLWASNNKITRDASSFSFPWNSTEFMTDGTKHVPEVKGI